MTESTTPQTILAIDDDLGFLMSLGLVFSDAGLQVLPSGSTQAALALLEELNRNVGLLIANAASLLDGAELAGILRRCLRPARVVVIVGAGETAAPPLPRGLVVAGILHRPRDPMAPPQDEWLQAVRRALAESETGAA